MINKEEKYKKGVDLLRAGKYEKALLIFNELVATFPENADFWSERGVVYFHLNRQELSLADMDKAAELQPLKSYRYASRAYIKGHFKMIHEAIEDYKKAIELDPDDAVAHNNLGLIEEQLGYQKSARERFNKADALANEVDGRFDLGKQGKSIPVRNIQREINEEKKKKSFWKELKSITTQEGFSSFIRFLKSGFKQT